MSSIGLSDINYPHENTAFSELLTTWYRSVGEFSHLLKKTPKQEYTNKAERFVWSVLAKLGEIILLFPVRSLMEIAGPVFLLIDSIAAFRKNYLQGQSKSGLKDFGKKMLCVLRSLVYMPINLINLIAEELLLPLIELVALIGSGGLLGNVEEYFKNIIDDALEQFTRLVSAERSSNSKIDDLSTLGSTVLTVLVLINVQAIFLSLNFKLNCIALLLNVVRNILIGQFSAVWKNLYVLYATSGDFLYQVRGQFGLMATMVLALPLETFQIVFNVERKEDKGLKPLRNLTTNLELNRERSLEQFHTARKTSDLQVKTLVESLRDATAEFEFDRDDDKLVEKLDHMTETLDVQHNEQARPRLLRI